MRSEIYHSLKTILREKGLNTNIGGEGGFAPSLYINREAVEVVLSVIEKAGIPCGSERTARYNHFMEIEMEFGPKAVFVGIRAFDNQNKPISPQAKSMRKEVETLGVRI